MLLAANASRFQSENHIMARVVKAHQTACYRILTGVLLPAAREIGEETFAGFCERFQFVDNRSDGLHLETLTLTTMEKLRYPQEDEQLVEIL